MTKNAKVKFTGNTKSIECDNTAVAIISSNTITINGAGTAKLTMNDTNSNTSTVNLKVIEILKGDCNLDGEVSIADAVMLQKWLLGSSNQLTYWQNADLCEDKRIDVFDMIMMRKLLIENK